VTKFGVAIAQSGTPIARASDYQRVIDTRWKTMSVVATQKIYIEDAFVKDQTIKLLDHNLGYLPAFEAPFYNTRFEVQSSQSGSYLFVADRTSIYLILTQGPGVGYEYTINGYITVYDLNMEEDYEGGDRGLLGSVGRSDRGIKLIGNGQYAARDVRDSDPIGFSVTTDAKAIGIDKVGTAQITGGVPFTVQGRGVIRHNLAYPPLVKVAIRYTPAQLLIFGNLIPAPSPSTAFIGPLDLPAGAIVEPQAVVLPSYFDETYRYVIFKEPTEIAG